MSRPPCATYRLQFHPGFTFADAAEVLPYIASLGVSHVYASPYLQASAGSTHGYDVVDPGRVNEELGGAEAHAAFCERLGGLGLGQVLDIVPNHMSITGTMNAWWWDVLENGASSRYAAYFDVDWDPPEARLSNAILLPILEDHYGRVLEAGLLKLAREGGAFLLKYRDHVLPLAPRSLQPVLARAAREGDSEALGFLAAALGDLPLATATDVESTRRRHRDKEVILALLERHLAEEPEVTRAVDRVLAEVNADPEALDDVVGAQNWRIAHWRAARRDLGYRRFFNIDSLAGLRAEDPLVFQETHRLVLRWLRDGVLDGVRVDHPDGLRDPEQYLLRLREHAAAAWLVVEKILAPGEQLPLSWPVEGTTGYDFIFQVTQVLLDPGGREPLSAFYRAFTGIQAEWDEVERASKEHVLREALGSDLNRLTELMLRCCEEHRRYRDYTRHDLHEVLREALTRFPVYRTYLRSGGGEVPNGDRLLIGAVLQAAREARPELDPRLFEFLEGLLLLRWPGEVEAELVARFQQLSGPTAAKGVEDTAFYRYNLFVALNEVGGDPGVWGWSPEAFHEAMERFQQRTPFGMRTTSTHDTKRSEDVRARLLVLAEIPDEWVAAVTRWAAHNDRHRRGEAPDRNEEYLLYQALVGAWPLEGERAQSFLRKALREGAVHTSWARPDPAWEEAALAFVNEILEDPWFLDELSRLVARVLVPGRINALAQVLLRLTVPGIPDTYQGCELWDLSLVDPDNRRPVDFELRARLLRELSDLPPEAILARGDEGLPKLHVIRSALALRRRRAEAFGAEGKYTPLEVEGEAARHALGFLRGGTVCTLVPRFPATLSRWGDTRVALPPGTWTEVLTGTRYPGGGCLLEPLLGRFPVALLERHEGGA